jgi:hypothetical protein
MQVFDQEIPLTRPIAEQALDRLLRLRIDLSALWDRTSTDTPSARVLEFTYLADVTGVVLFTHAPKVKTCRDQELLYRTLPVRITLLTSKFEGWRHSFWGWSIPGTDLR